MAVKYAGRNSVVYMSINGTTAAINVGGMRAFTMDGTQETIDTTEFQASNRTSVLGFPAYSGTLEGFWASDDTTLRSASASQDGTNLYLYPAREAPSKYIGGPAWVDMSIRSAVDQAVGTTANFTAKGTWVNNL